MNGRDDTTTFLLLDSRIGGQNEKSLDSRTISNQRPNQIHI